MAKSHLKLVAPATEKRTVTPTRRPNADLRTREYLTEAEVERLLKATKGNRWAHRDATMILVAYRHGLRASEAADLRWDQVDFATATLHVRRVKQGSPSTHPILGDELRSASSATARAGAQVALRVHVGARRTVHHRGLCPDGRAGRRRGELRVQGASAHAAARLRLCAGVQGARHPCASGLPRPQEHSAHRALHGVVADSFQELLARLMTSKPEPREKSQSAGGIRDPNGVLWVPTVWHLHSATPFFIGRPCAHALRPSRCSLASSAAPALGGSHVINIRYAP